ncbi:MAG TPA: hypothetical protein VJ650_00080 [Gemmatimonadaceae bacterium]|nr:hypothetical protein [Gemmatimonadaceae bacterium]
MLRDRVLRGVWIGLVAAAATAGALVGFGWVRGFPLQPLNTIAHILVGSRAFYVREAHPLITPLGLLVHALSLVVWGALFSLGMGYRRSSWLWVGAVVFAVAVAAIDFLVLPARLSPGFETVLTRGEIIVIYAVMAAAMGMVAGSLGAPPAERGTRYEEAP